MANQNPQSNQDPDLSQAEKRLKENLVATGKVARDITNKAFKELIASVNEYSDLLKGIDQQLEDQLDKYSDIKGVVGGLGTVLKDNAAALGKNNELAQGAKGIYNSLNRIASDLVNNQEDLVTGQLASKDVARDLNKALIISSDINKRLAGQQREEKDLEDQLMQARRTGTQDEIDAIIDKINANRAVAEGLRDQQGALTDITANLQDQLKSASKIENKVGIAGKLLSGFKKIPVLGDMLDLDGAETAMKATAARGFQPLMAGVKALGPSLKAALGPLGLITMAAEVIKFFIDAMFEADKQVTEIARNLGISKEQASGVRDYFYEVADSAKDYSTTLKGTILLQKDVLAAQLAFNDVLDTSIVLQKENLQQLTIAKTIIQLSDEAMTGLSMAFTTTGKNAEDIEKSILGTSKAAQASTGIFLQDKKILEGVLKATGGIRLNFKGSYEALALAVTKATMLGTTMEKLESTTNSLLDFESSIQSQMEAELLTSKALNLNAARYYALTNQTEKLMDEMAKNMGDFNEYSNMNRITQDAYAKSLGMSRDDMADMLLKQKAIQALRTLGRYDDKKTIIEQFDALQKEKKTREEIAKTLGEQAYNALLQESAEDKFAKALDKAKEAFEKLVDGGTLDKLVNLITDLVQSLVKNGAFSTFFGSGIEEQRRNRQENYAEKTLNSYKGVTNDKLTDEDKKAIQEASAILQERVSRQQDVEREYKRSTTRTYKADVGDFTINPLPEDTITASSGRGGVTIAGGTRLGRTDEMVEELKQQNRLLAALLAKDTTIQVDGQMIANAVARNVPTSYGNLLNPASNTYLPG